MYILYDMLRKVRNMMKYEVTECRRGDIHFGPDFHLLWLRLVVCGQQSQEIYFQVCMVTGHL